MQLSQSFFVWFIEVNYVLGVYKTELFLYFFGYLITMHFYVIDVWL